MDHLEAREQLELAAVEPGGLERLMAGDTPTATALAGHLAGCDDCTEEFARLRRSADVLRDVVSTMPPADLKERTLAFVAAVGRPRGATAPGSAPEGWAAPVAPVAPVKVVEVPTPISQAPSRRRAGRFAWLAAAAALVVVTAGSTGFVVATAKDAQARQASLELEGLAEVASWTVRLDAQPDVRHVLLTSNPVTNGMPQLGTLVFSPHTQELVVVTNGMTRPPAGQEYRCWVEVGGARQRLGKMYLSGNLAYWVGDAAVLATVPAGSIFGVSLADVDGSAGPSPAILSGTLQAS
jgi:hypothetical protein